MKFKWPEGVFWVDVETGAGYTLRVQKNGLVFLQDGSTSIGLGVYDLATSIMAARGKKGLS